MNPTSIYCLPCAGGSGTTNYARWRQQIAQWCRIKAVDYPGRGKRISEPPIRSFSDLAVDTYLNIKDDLPERYILFGHSFGGLVAYECAQILKANQQRQPLALFVACVAAPTMINAEQYDQEWTDSAVLQKMKSMGGTPDELFQYPEMLAMMIANFAADLNALKTFTHDSTRPKLEIPIFIIGAEADEITHSELAAWGTMTNRKSNLSMFKGGHFIPLENYQGILRYIESNAANL